MSDYTNSDDKKKVEIISTTFIESDTDNKSEGKVENTTEVDAEDTVNDDYITSFFEMSNEARSEDERDKKMTLKEGFKMFPKAVIWSTVISCAIIMEAYDQNLLSSFYAYPAFAKRFGVYYPKLNKWEIPAKWQMGWAMSYQTTQLIGLYLSSHFVDKIGYKKTIMFPLVASIALIFLQFFAPTKEVLLVAYVFLGLFWGCFQSITVTYAAEVAPVSLRGYQTSLVNAFWVIGKLISSGTVKGISNMENPNAYKIAYAIQWIWPVPLLIGVYFAPESPWQLVRRGKVQAAKKAVCRLISTPNNEVVADQMVTKMQMTLAEESITTKGVSILDLFKGNNLRRTFIVSMLWNSQRLAGGAISNYSTYFYEQAGLSVSNAFTFTVGEHCLSLFGNIIAWIAIKKFGYYTIYLFGLIMMFICMMLAGIFGSYKGNSTGWGAGSSLLIFSFFSDLSVGPLVYILVSEIPSARLRNKTVMFGRLTYLVIGIITSIITPYMLNPASWAWGAKTGYFYGGFGFIFIVWSIFCLPETKGLTFAEIDWLFENKIHARKFKSTKVNLFDAEKLVQKLGSDGVKDVVKERD
ncbi:unnamed protein product [Candida verbasci]|uniref:Major facilitator superfamily (MFS) profile domain-containing protein n=1 Tax=Candida verbasci TaxID=1227364 RepID=A0A9W4U1M5_9ASCO|nr:unnamed protein product [Candida verbasci]